MIALLPGTGACEGTTWALLQEPDQEPWDESDETATGPVVPLEGEVGEEWRKMECARTGAARVLKRSGRPHPPKVGCWCPALVWHLPCT